MKAIFKRELKSYFHNVIGWLFIAAYLFVLGLYFTVYNLMNAYPMISYTLSGALFLFIITFPILSMRVLSEERKNKTDQLLLTAPVSTGKIVMGKYLAMAVIFAVVNVVACIYPIIMSFFGTVDFPQAYVAILGFLLYGLSCIAIGMFVSSVTESQVLAAVGSFAIMFITFMMSGIAGLITSGEGILYNILEVFDLQSPAINLMDGSLDLCSVLYYLSIIFVFCFLTTWSIQKRRWEITKSNAKLGLFSGAYVAVMIVICVGINIAANLLPEDITAIDVTSNKLYSLGDDTYEMLSELEDDVTIYVLASEANCDSVIAKTVERYASASKHVTVEYKDPTTYPNFYSSYASTAPTTNSVIVVSGDMYKVIDYYDIYVVEYSMDSTTYQYTSETTGYDGEGQITSAISYVTSSEMPMIYVLTGQDEPEIGSSFTDAISKKNAAYEEIDLLSYDAVPEDCELLIINSPMSDLSDDVTEKILDYIENGGNLYVVVSYTEDDMENLNKILSVYGMSTTGGLLCDNDANCYTQYPYYPIAEVSSTDVSSSVAGEYIFLPQSTGLTYEETDDVTVTEIATSSESTVIKMNPETMESFEAEEGDLEGSYVLAAYAELNLDTAVTESGDASGDASETLTSELVIVNGYYFLSDEANSMVSDNNLDLFSDGISQLVQSAEGVSVAVKDYGIDYLTVSNRMIIVYSLVFAVVVPVILIVIGVVIWAKRRKR
ncbi:MAG: Gldg family protein [Eubacterium sp.]|nr:Gldg family protein [Eubacterium sp.]